MRTLRPNYQIRCLWLCSILLFALPGWTATAPGDPPTSGLLLWLKADALHLQAGAPVTTWEDASGKGHPAVFTRVRQQGTPPLLMPDAINGKPAVRFTNGLLRVQALPLGTFTIAAVFTTAGEGMLYEHSDGEHSYAICRDGCYLATGGESPLSIRRQRRCTNKTLVDTRALSTGQPVLAVTTFSGSDAGLQLFLNGSVQPLTANELSGINTTDQVTAHFDIGMRAYYGDMPFQGDLAELLVYDHVAAPDELAQLHNALQLKYGLNQDTVWVEDALPAGAIPVSDNGEGWNWVSHDPTPFSGTLASQSSLAAGQHQHFFHGATATLAVETGDTLIAYIYLDPAHPPTEVMLQYRAADGSWEHRAYWGANQIILGTDATDSRRAMGALPATGQWVRLAVPADQIGLAGKTLDGMAFTLFDGRATWDHAGKVAGQHKRPTNVSTGAK